MRIHVCFVLGVMLWQMMTLSAQEVTITIDASRETHQGSPLLIGACIEDVNHEIYGGIYSQMIFGESFQEPPLVNPIEGFVSYEGEWQLAGEMLSVGTGRGNKLIAKECELRSGTVSVDLQFDSMASGNAGVILRVSQEASGADHFFGYEFSLNPAAQVITIGRHRNNWEPIVDVPCEVKLNQWHNLRVEMQEDLFKVFVDGSLRHSFQDQAGQGLDRGKIGLRQWERSATFRNLLVTQDAIETPLAFRQSPLTIKNAVSRMWQGFQTQSAQAEYELITGSSSSEPPFIGAQSQKIRYAGGDGWIGISNRGLNHWGHYYQSGKEYEGVLYAKADTPTKLCLTMANQSGSETVAEQWIEVTSQDWQRLDFKLTPNQTIQDGKFSIQLNAPGEVDLGYVALHPGAWGRFKDLPVRRDVAQLLIDQGIQILRYGGSMINNDRYRWKNMIGPRELRPPYQGFWYRYSTNGWGILDFMNFCEAAGFEYVPTFCMSETPEDMADFVRYSKDLPDSIWGKRRVADGHPAPYQLKYLQLGNEERVDVDFAQRFADRAKAIWEVDPTICIVVGDFVYDHLIHDPQKVTGALSGITNLDGQKKILEFAKSQDQEVWFDVHVWTGGPRPNQSFDAMFTYIDQLEKLADGAKFKVLTFEFNSNNHDQRRALANALAINAIERDGRLPIATSANCLQPDGQNDNGWDQGLLFLTPSKVWLQPPGYVTQMFSRKDRSRVVATTLNDPNGELDCTAKLSEDGTTLILQAVNLSSSVRVASLKVSGFTPKQQVSRVVQLSAPLDSVNSVDATERVKPEVIEWRHELPKGTAELLLAPTSVTVIELR